MHATKRLLLLGGLILGLVTFATAATADSINSITFETYNTGSINGQQGWMKTGPFDATVNNVNQRYGFGNQALRISDAVTSGSFGDQTFSPGLANAAGETTSMKLFKSSFQIGTTQDALQTGLHVSVSPDSGDGGRMTYVRFEDQADGVHVFFDDVTNPGPVGTESTFNERDIATLDSDERSYDRVLGPLHPRPAQRPGHCLRRRCEDHRYDVGGLLPLRPGAAGARDPARVQDALPRQRRSASGQSGQRLPGRRSFSVVLERPDPHRRQIHPRPQVSASDHEAPSRGGASPWSWTSCRPAR